MSDTSFDFRHVGGVPIEGAGTFYGDATGWDFGWLPPDRRDVQADADAIAAQVPFTIIGPARSTGAATKAALWECWSDPRVMASVGGLYPGVHQITGSCFPSGTPVRMADGSEKAVEAVRVGDEVVSHTGRARRVVETMRRDYTGDMVTIQPAGFAFPLTMTADHPVAVLPSRCAWRWQPDEIEWRRADELEEGDRVLIGWGREAPEEKVLDLAELLGDRAMVLDDLMGEGDAPVSNVPMAQRVCRNSGIDWRGRVKLVKSRHENALLRNVPVCPSLGRLVGLYLAEGGHDAGRVTFTFDVEEASLAAETVALVRGLFGVEGEVYGCPSHPTSIQARFSNNSLAAVFEAMVPGNVYGKRVPGLFFRADEETKLALLLGWMHGDGYAAERTTGKGVVRLQGVTVCKGLARDMTVLGLSCGLRVSTSRRKARKQSREAYDVHLSGPKAVALFPAMAEVATRRMKRKGEADTARTEFGYARAIKKVTKAAATSLPVYDFEVEEDHSFLAGDLTVHNCVGAGGGNNVFALSAVEVVRLGDAEQVLIPFWPLAYGRSRVYAGLRGRGEGSFAGAFGRAAKEDGFIPATTEGLPAFTREDGLVWGRSAELEWSDGAKIAPRWLEQSRKHLVKSVAPIKSADQCRDALVNGYPVMFCGDWGGLMRCPAQGTPAVLMNRRSGQWMHNQTALGWWDHPTEGEIYFILNQWGMDAHGRCPSGAPPGGYWIKRAEMEYQCRNGECLALSQFDGFPSLDYEVPWLI